MLDIFVTHAWRQHDDWTRLNDILYAELGDTWRNFSCWWFDPGLSPSSEIGQKRMMQSLEGQMRPVQAVVVLSSLFSHSTFGNWVEKQIDIAKRLSIPLVALPATPGGEIPADLVPRVDACSDWDAASLVASLRTLAAQRAGSSGS